MKTKILNVILVVCIGIVIYSCRRDDDVVTVETPCEEECGMLMDTIPREVAMFRDSVYVANQYQLINNNFESMGLNIKDNREYNFELEKLKAYICYVEEQAEAMGLGNATLGIRVYNSAILTDVSDESTGDTEEVALSSVFFIGTYQTPNVNRSAKSANNSFQNISGIDAFNYGSSGKPPVTLQ